MTSSQLIQCATLTAGATCIVTGSVTASAQTMRDFRTDRVVDLTRLEVQKSRETIEREASERMQGTIDEVRSKSNLKSSTPLVAGYEHQGRKIMVIDNPREFAGSRSIDPWTVAIGGNLPFNPMAPNVGQPVVINDCGPVEVLGRADAAVVGRATSRVDLYRGNDLIATDQKTFWTLSGVKQHDFLIEAPLASGTYTLKQGVIVFGNTMFNSNTLPFEVQNTANCATRLEYSGHIQGSGSTGWLQAGARLGTTGESRRLEAFAMRVHPAQGSNISICYQAHVQGTGWQSARCDGSTAGTTGASRRMEAIKIWFGSAPGGCLIQYRVHMKGKGWSSWTTNGNVAGTTGQNRRIEALEARLAGPC